MLYLLEYFIQLTSACVIIIFWGFKQKQAAFVMNRLLEVDIQLSGFKGEPFHKRVLVFLIIHGIVNSCLWSTIWLTSMSYHDFYSFIITFLKATPDTVVYWYMLEYVTILSLAARDLQTVNYYLLKMNEIRDYPYRPPASNGQLIVTGSPTRYNGRLASLKLLRSVRTTLYELCEDIDDFFSLPILFCAACCFFPLFRQMYTLATYREHGFSLSLLAFTSYEIILMYIYPIAALALNASRVGNETTLTARILHKLLNEEMRRGIRAELQEFSHQLLHEDLKFSAYGFFTIDATTIGAILSGTATYFVVLMQYQELPECLCENQSTVNSTISNSTFPTNT